MVCGGVGGWVVLCVVVGVCVCVWFVFVCCCVWLSGLLHVRVCVVCDCVRLCVVVRVCL